MVSIKSKCVVPILVSIIIALDSLVLLYIASKILSQRFRAQPKQITNQVHLAQHLDSETDPTRIPAYIEDDEILRDLPATLSEERLAALVPNAPRHVERAYAIAREIPKILAQLPCYCYCDRYGHKSLHSCYETDHAFYCDKCIHEALLAYDLTKKGFSLEQIRERIVSRKGREAVMVH